MVNLTLVRCTLMCMSPLSSHWNAIKVSNRDLVELLTWIFNAEEAETYRFDLQTLQTQPCL